jgi:cytochrome b pre-mRNA-processing protein 3
MLTLLRKTAARKQEVRRLYDDLVSRARSPVFFISFGVADTIDGRFDLLVLHAWLALKALKQAGHGLPAQALTDMIFLGFDEAMREQGAGDMGLGHKLKKFANAFYGRLTAYETAQTEADLAEALARNLWRGGAVDGRALALAAYVQAAKASLAASVPGRLDFGPLPAI